MHQVCLDVSIKDALYNYPGKGVILSQALLSPTPEEDPSDPRGRGIELLKNEVEPSSIFG